MQALNSISAEHNSTIIFPLPIDMLSFYMKSSSKKKSGDKKALLEDEDTDD